MFEHYLEDSAELYNIANNEKNENNEREARRYYRASIFYAASALEAFLNYIIESFSLSGALSEMEIAFLKDKKYIFSNSERNIIEQTEYHRLDDKIKFLVNRFNIDYDFKSSSWSRYNEFKILRDDLIHPKNDEDNITLDNYYKIIKLGIGAIIDIMNTLSFGLYKKPLRKKLIDLIPD